MTDNLFTVAALVAAIGLIVVQQLYIMVLHKTLDLAAKKVLMLHAFIKDIARGKAFVSITKEGMVRVERIPD